MINSIYWIGGSPCAGKSSISQRLAERFGFDLYAVDRAFDQHVQDLDPSRHPALTRWCNSTWDQRWMEPVDQLLAEVIACYTEHFSFVLADVLAMSKGKPLLVEGSCLLPRLVVATDGKNPNMVWVVPTAEFQRHHYSQRAWIQTILTECREPQLAFHNWMERDMRFAEWVAREAELIGKQVLWVDGQQSLDENLHWVARQFGLG